MAKRLTSLISTMELTFCEVFVLILFDFAALGAIYISLVGLLFRLHLVHVLCHFDD